MSNNPYVNTGKCIWCGRQEPDVSFETAAHIVPHSLGGSEIGCDICDDCNHVFGTSPKVHTPSIDLVFKEIFNAYKVFGHNLNEYTHKDFHSVYFSYWHSKHLIRINRNFNPVKITRQFKRGLYEVFLQKYHFVTGNGNHPMFDMVRKFARYDIGNPHVLYAFNNIILMPSDKNVLKIPMNKIIIDEIMEYGIYPFWMMGQIFYLEILPMAYNSKGQIFLRKEANKILIPALGNECIFEFSNIMQLDFLMKRFNSKK